jgi:hypothetical protein
MSSQNPSGNAKTALVKIVVAAVVLCTIYFSYARYVENSKAVKAASKAAAALIKLDGPNEYAEAAAKLDEALAIRDTDPYAVSARAMVAAVRWVDHGVASEQQVATAQAARAKELEFNTKERFLAEALVDIGSGRLDAAEAKLLDLVKNNLAVAEVVAGLGYVHKRSGKLELARNDFSQAADRDFQSARYQALHGEALLELGELGLAAQAFDKAYKSNANHLRTIIGLARVAAAQGEAGADRALETLDTKVFQMPNPDKNAPVGSLVARPETDFSAVLKAAALLAKAEALVAANRGADAETAANAAISADATSAFAHYALAGALALQNKDGAVAEVDKAIELAPGVAKFSFAGALMLQGMGKSAEADALLVRYASKNKPDDAFNGAQGDLLAAQGKLDDALKSYDAAIQANAMKSEHFSRKGAVLVRKGMTLSGAKKRELLIEAITTLDEAIKLRKSNIDALRWKVNAFISDNPKVAEVTDGLKLLLKTYDDQRVSASFKQAFVDDIAEQFKKAGAAKMGDDWKKNPAEFVATVQK